LIGVREFGYEGLLDGSKATVLAAVDRGTPREEIVRLLGVSHLTIRRYLRLRRETTSVAPKPSPERPPRVGGTAEQRHALWVQLEAHLLHAVGQQSPEPQIRKVCLF
jgi:transposase